MAYRETCFQGLRPSEVLRLTENTREGHRWERVYGRLVCTAVTPTCAPAPGVLTHWLARRSESRTLREQTHPQISRNTPRCPSVVLWPPCSGVEWGAFEPAITVRGSGTREQPANLAVEGSEESLSTLSDYTPTVRPPPKRC